MKYKLEVSYDCGISYEVDSSYESLDDPKLHDIMNKFDDEGFRYVVVDEKEDIKRVSFRHVQIIEDLSIIHEMKI